MTIQVVKGLLSTQSERSKNRLHGLKSTVTFQAVKRSINQETQSLKGEPYE